MTCSTCRFFVRHDPQHIYGDCHRQPPQMTFSAYFYQDDGYGAKKMKAEISRQRDGFWPNVSQDEWCGEYAPPTPTPSEGGGL
jgi:hypothetical protein